MSKLSHRQHGGKNGVRLALTVLSLERQVDRDLFESLCRTLVGVVGRATDSSTALALALRHVRRWKNFLSGRSQRLSQEQVRGLFAELTFLLELLDRGVACADAISAWHGPDRSQHDFIRGNYAVEIKSLSGTERNFVRISSEDQLESLNDKLYLRVYRLSEVDDSGAAHSLSERVREVMSTLRDADAADDFEHKLSLCGYAPLPAYDKPQFLVSELRTFLVEDGFPCLVKSALPSGVERVSYAIRLEAVVPFRCNDAEVFEVL